MSAVTDTISQVAAEVKEVYLVDKAAFETLLKYLTSKAYAEVASHLEAIKDSQLCKLNYTTPPAAPETAPATDSTQAS
jgi:hypothetical protein